MGLEFCIFNKFASDADTAIILSVGKVSTTDYVAYSFAPKSCLLLFLSYSLVASFNLELIQPILCQVHWKDCYIQRP